MHKFPYQDDGDAFRIYIEDEKGGFRDEYGNSWSPPISRITKTWQKLKVFQTFGETMLATKDRVEWRTQTRHRRVDRVTAYYPGFTPADRASQKDFRLYVDVESNEMTGHAVTWFGQQGRYTFIADRDKPEAADHILKHAIEHLLTVGAAIEKLASQQNIEQPATC